MVKDKQLFKNYNNIWEKTEKSKTDRKHLKAALLQIFMVKRAYRKNTIQILSNNSVRFRY